MGFWCRNNCAALSTRHGFPSGGELDKLAVLAVVAGALEVKGCLYGRVKYPHGNISHASAVCNECACDLVNGLQQVVVEDQ